MNNSQKTDPGYIDSGNCDLGKNFDPRHCQFLHYRAKNREGYDPCRYCPLIIKFLKKERGKYKVEKRKRKQDRSGTCEHCKKTVNWIVGRGLCPKCYGNSEIKEKYPPKVSPIGQKKQPVTIIKTGLTKNSDSGQNEKSAPKTGAIIRHCPAPETHLPSIEIVEERKRLSLQPLTDLLADRLEYLKELRRQAAEQNRLLDMKLFEVNTFEKLCSDLQTTIERMRA